VLTEKKTTKTILSVATADSKKRKQVWIDYFNTMVYSNTTMYRRRRQG